MMTTPVLTLSTMPDTFPMKAVVTSQHTLNSAWQGQNEQDSEAAQEDPR